MSKEKFAFVKPSLGLAPRADSWLAAQESVAVSPSPTKAPCHSAKNSDVYATATFAVVCVVLLVVLGAFLRRRARMQRGRYELVPSDPAAVEAKKGEEVV
ncbi:hypothetical protein EXIGLDRAFT_839162 [Exidia glandulosa HHB12029]|uniref:Uncharacterized protein n=1 Tax=Exidia glandulosa HHB12029 TaxID=1314781 RepID=A0A165F8E5_EXIGL|nr:hypothetical protein EXIGLDRAFT_839162 [Exidia glandulosa HHB12029]